MTLNRDDLSQAVIVCLGYGVALSPVWNEPKLVETFGQQKGAELLNGVRKLTDEAAPISIDWSNSSLEAAGKAVRAEMHNRHPHLDNIALDAIAWKFTYDWR